MLLNRDLQSPCAAALSPTLSCWCLAPTRARCRPLLRRHCRAASCHCVEYGCLHLHQLRSLCHVHLQLAPQHRQMQQQLSLLRQRAGVFWWQLLALIWFLAHVLPRPQTLRPRPKTPRYLDNQARRRHHYRPRPQKKFLQHQRHVLPCVSLISHAQTNCQNHGHCQQPASEET